MTGIPQPKTVKPIKVLGRGRAAQAILVDATFDSGKTVRCVEKRFSPGWLTRFIYRIGFQSPFAYQSNRDAILTCYYRRLVVSQILKGLGESTAVASPLYVRFDQPSRSWVLAAEWIQGRGVRPANADHRRPLRWIQEKLGFSQRKATSPPAEIDELVHVMRKLESQLHHWGLSGTGWQVSPTAIVSTANLLRVNDRYITIDLESGIPAVLVFRYLLDGLKRFQLPPFDELDSKSLRQWFQGERAQLARQLGSKEISELENHIEQLIGHHQAWKQSEVALFRSPQRWLKRSVRQSYRRECVRRWRQDKTIDHRLSSCLGANHFLFTLIWLMGLLPGRAGRLLSRFFGHQKYRQQLGHLITNPSIRRRFFGMRLSTGWRQLQAHGRIPHDSPAGWLAYQAHSFLSKVLTLKAHQFLTDRRHRNLELWRCWLLLSSPKYQTRHANRKIRLIIGRWRASQRITQSDANRIRQAVSAKQMRHYLRGFSYHLSLKLLSPFLAPFKIAGLIKLYETANPIYLLPFFATSILRVSATLVNRWLSRKDSPSHQVAISLSWLPIVGIASFPVQMYASNVQVSQFLIRDFASRLGKKFPIYGGEDSRLEIAMIQSTDWIFALMQLLTKTSSHEVVQQIEKETAGEIGLISSTHDEGERISIQSTEIQPPSRRENQTCPSDNQNRERLVA